MLYVALLLSRVARVEAQQEPAGGGLLEPIVVSARARDTSASLLGASVLHGSQLVGSRAAVTLDEALVRVPGLYAPNRFQGALDHRIVIRGSGARSPFGTRGVVVVLDGVPQTLPDGQTQLSHVEPAALGSAVILRGPAAAFYGNGAGGVVLLASPPPPRGVEVRLVGGSHGMTAARAAAGALAVGARVGLELSRVVQTGFRSHSAQDLRLATLSADVGAGDGWRATARLRVSDLARAENPGALDSAQLATDPSQANARNVAFGAGKTVRQVQGSLEIRRRGRAAEAALVLFAVDRDLDNPLASVWVLLNRTDYGLRLLVRRSLGWIEVNGGLDVQLQRDLRLNFDNDSGRMGTAPRLDQTENVAAAGGRISARSLLGDRASVMAALRADRISFSVSDRLLANGDASGRRSMSAVTAAAALGYELSEAWRARAVLGDAFETPTTTELADPSGGLSAQLEPQRSRQAELGLDWSGRTASVSVALYRGATRDAIVPREDSTSPGRFVFRNVGRIENTGIEVAAQWRLARWLSAAAAASVSRHRYARFPADSGSLSGRRVPGVPERTLFAELIAGRDRHAAAEVVVTGPVAADDANRWTAAGSTLFNLRFGWPLGARANLFGGVRNLFASRWIASVTVNGAAGRVFEPGPGRTVYAGISAGHTSRVAP